MPYVVEVNTDETGFSRMFLGPTFVTQDEAVEYVCQKYDRLVEKSNEPMLYSSGEPMFPEGHEFEIDARVISNTYRVVEVSFNA